MAYPNSAFRRHNNLQQTRKWLDQVYGIYWPHRINLDTLNLMANCLIHQLEGNDYSWESVLRKYGNHSIYSAIGYATGSNSEYLSLWKILIPKLREQRPINRIY